MSDDYESAALRHFKDAQLLAREKRFDNAGHLIGFAAECALKKKLRELNRNENAEYQGHHREPLHQIRIIIERKRMAGPWLALCRKSDYLLGWNIAGRYSSDGQVTEATFNLWMRQARDVLAMARVYDRSGTSLDAAKEEVSGN